MALLNLTNFDDHPEDPAWLVFRFTEPGIAGEYKEALREIGIGCEIDLQGGPLYLVAVRQRHREAAVRANYRVLGRHRQPFIGDGLLRWVVLGGVGLLLALAIAGALLR